MKRNATSSAYFKDKEYFQELRKEGLKLHMISIQPRRDHHISATGDKHCNYRVIVTGPYHWASGVGTPKRALIEAWRKFKNESI